MGVLQKTEGFRHISSWTGFHIKLRQRIDVSQSNVGYLDCVDAPTTNMSTVYFMLESSLKIKDQLNINSVICVYDQAIYAKAYQIKCNDPAKFQDAFLMMGTFHIILTFMAVSAARFKDAELKGYRLLTE